MIQAIYGAVTHVMRVPAWAGSITDAIHATRLAETAFGDNVGDAPGRAFGVTLGVRY